MDKGEYWILNVLIEGRCVLSLLDPDNIEWHFSPGHGLDRSQLIDTLDNLFQHGDLLAERRIDGFEEVFVPTHSEIAMALSSEEEDVAVSLTPQGGSRWEEFSNPNWNCYIGVEWGEGDWWGASSTDRRLVERYLDSPKTQARIKPDSVVWDEPSPFQATYWKTLPAGYRVRFRLLPPAEDDGINPWPQSDAKWYFNYFVGGTAECSREHS